MSGFIDLAGSKFGRWTAIRVYEKRPNRDGGTRVFWECRCDCGNVRSVDAASLKSGHSKSCGCIKKEGRRTLPRGVPERNLVLRTYRKNAELRSLEFSLTMEQFTELTQQDCFYCGAKPDKSVRGRGFDGNYTYNGVDRVDNSIGYVLENCVSCCERCNRAKGTMSEDELADWVVKVYHRFAASKKFWNGIYMEFDEKLSPSI
jgi:hypothetical protein